MTQHWNVLNDCLEIQEMPFYWRLGQSANKFPAIPSRLGIRVVQNAEFDYLEYQPSHSEWAAIETAYKQNENIGFVNPESGQIHTYGSSVNNFFLETINAYQPQRIFEIGCGAGFSIQFLKQHGWSVTGIDPSEYSLQWSERLQFPLLNTFFDEGVLDGQADFIFCNDVFEHVRQVEIFARNVFKALKAGGIFCIATTNSTESIAIGDISMLEHQHVNMFTARSISLILANAGFTDIKVGKGSYGNTFHVVAKKGEVFVKEELPPPSCMNYFEKAKDRISLFGDFYKSMAGHCRFYVPLRCIPYLATVGDFGESALFDSNTSWRGKYIDGYNQAIQSLSDVESTAGGSFFIGSMTFHQEIRRSLLDRGLQAENIFSVFDLAKAT